MDKLGLILLSITCVVTNVQGLRPALSKKAFPVHRVVEKKASREAGFFFFFFLFFCVCVTVGETSVCFISLSFYEIHRHIIYQKKADFLTNLVTGVWNNWLS